MFWKTASPTPSGTISQIGPLLSAGDSNSCALLTDGTIRCWGYNGEGELGNGNTTDSFTPVTVSGVSSAVAVSMGFSQGCAVLLDGTARCWGYNDEGQIGDGSTTDSWIPITVSGLSNVVGISTSSSASVSCAVIGDGTARCWGFNGSYGQLGSGTTINNSTTPVTVSGLSNATAVSVGGDHVCSLLSDGTARCWGYNGERQLGNGVTTPSNVPVTVSGLSGAVAISAGGYHNCVLLSNGTSQCWGYNGKGQLGNGNTVNSSAPVTVSGLSGITAVTAGQYHSCALLSDGTARCWGKNTYGQLGNGSLTDSILPVTVSGLSGAVAIAAGNFHTCALLQDGSARCWGWSFYGQLGVGGSMRAYDTTPVTVSGVSTAVALGVGGSGAGSHKCTLLSDGTVSCWGYNATGQLGDGSTVDNFKPTTVSGLSSVLAVSAGSDHSCAVLSDGSARCWGYNLSGQLGSGNTTITKTPVTVSGLSGAVDISAGVYHSCALLADGTARCWGANYGGQIGNGSTLDPISSPVTVSGLSNVINISAGNNQSCAVLSDGTGRCWGYNSKGELGNGNTTISRTPVTVSGLSGAVRMATGMEHSCALLADGTAQCWGSNVYGRLGNGSTTNSFVPVTVSGLSGAVAIDAGDYHSCALLSDGTVRCWGYNLYGRLGNGNTANSSIPVTVSGLSGAVGITTGDDYSCALLWNGSISCWGRYNFSDIQVYTLRFLTGNTQVYGYDRNSSSPLSGLTATSPVSANGIASSALSIQLTQGSGSAWSGVVPTFSATDTLGKNVAGTCSVTDASGVSTCSLKSTYAEVKELWLTSPIQTLANPTNGIAFTAGSPAKLVVSGQGSLSTGSCSSRPYQVTLTDSEGNLVTAGSNFTATLSGLGNASVYSDPQCTQAMSTTLGFATGSSGWNFYLKDATAETLSLSATASGLTSESLSVTFIYPLSSTFSSITGSSPVVADGVSTSTVTITIKNAGNVGIPGIVPTFSATDTGSTNSYGACSSTDASGISTCTLSSTRAETKTLSLLTPVAKTGANVLFAAGTATKLVFTAQPSASQTVHYVFSPQPVVKVHDAYGNIVTTASNSITLSAYTDSGCTTTLAPGTLNVSTNPLSATSGVSTFSNVSYKQRGDIYLKAEASGLTSACSSKISVASPPAGDTVHVANNAGGAATYTISMTTMGTNRLVLLAVTWKNTTAMTTLPSGGPGGWTSIGAINQGTGLRTEVFRTFASAQDAGSTITITVPSGAKSSAVLTTFKNVDTSGTNGSGAIDVVTTGAGTTANPSLSITPVSSTQDTLIFSFLGNGNSTWPTAGTGVSMSQSDSSTGGGPGSRTTTSGASRVALGVSGVAATVSYVLSAIDWTQLNIVLKGP